MPGANQALRTARVRLDSTAAPGQPTSHQELADLVNAWIYQRYRRMSCLTANYIGKLERGVVGWPQADYREALRAILHADTDADLGFRRPVRSTSAAAVREEGDVNRKAFFRTALGAAVSLPMTELAQLSQQVEVPTTVRPTDIHELRVLAGVFSAWDHTYGGSLIREALYAQLRYSISLLKHASCPRPLHGELYTAVGWLAHTGAAMAFDAFAHDDARDMFSFALFCAEEAQDWHLRAKILSLMARQAIWCEDADHGLTLVELALVRADRLTPAERAMLYTARARATAKLGMLEETLESIGRADDQFTRIRPADEAPWMRYYDAAQHAGDTGHALYDLALLVDRRYTAEASHRLSSAVAGHSAQYVRSRATSGIKLASLIMATGDPQEAAEIGLRATIDAGRVRSCRTRDTMSQLSRLAVPHERLTPVAELRHQIRTVTCT
ncbi:XRE family transcriptional regulator [Nonomuraea typhae]|uniref:XRE family transcriptional regulator n=1 Tax=Nonomuraea typhae TaxID=2603600 RepID=UPI0012F8C46F|nr:XRE family transcriptional regulator [Nonomuraea typhae]